MRDVDQKMGALAHRQSRELRCAVLGDDDTRVVARCRDDRSFGEQPDDVRHHLTLVDPGRTEADERVRIEVELCGRDEILVSADTRDLLAADVVRHHLAVEINRQRTIDGDQVGVPGDDRGVVHRLDREEGDVGIAVQPLGRAPGSRARTS